MRGERRARARTCAGGRWWGDGDVTLGFEVSARTRALQTTGYDARVVFELSMGVTIAIVNERCSL